MKKKTTEKVISKKIDQKPSAAITRFPSPIVMHKTPLSDDQKIDKIADHFTHILEILGMDLSNDSIAHTPQRIARMYVKEIFSGLNNETFPKISCFKDEFHHEHKANMVFVKVGFTSFCEHHFVPMNGIAYVAYLPSKHLIGLSKIPRIVRFFAKRPQLQERLTAQIADSLSILLNTDDVAVSITAQHYCVIARGIEDENGHTITNVIRGQFHTNESLKKEFFEGINRNLTKAF
ncbi:MAG: GTP cyclohydrolase I FolE [Parachlamydiaceae bacterium]|nr:GTP cyclohydrolase I FolE [Parachlamydiaceae bacterium]